MSLWKMLFGGSSSAEKAAAESPPEVYNGFTIRAAPFKSGPNFQVAGVIEKEIAGVRKEHRFIRADSSPSYEDAVTYSLSKARQIIDLQGELIFDERN